MQLMIVVMIILGLVLIYSAVKGRDPRELIKTALRRGV